MRGVERGSKLNTQESFKKSILFIESNGWKNRRIGLIEVECDWGGMWMIK